MPKLFGTSGIRGHGENYFTDPFCVQIARAFDQFLLKTCSSGAIAIGNDPRGSSPRIKTALTAGFNFTHREVFDQGTTCTPAMCYVLKNEPYQAAIMVTGSHIAADLNGVKFFFNQEEIQKKHEAGIEQEFARLSGLAQMSTVSDTHPVNLANDQYLDLLVNQNRSQSPLKIVVDCGNGSQSDLMPEVLRRLGHQVIEKNCSIQGEFIARDTEVDGFLLSLQQDVIKKQADLGIAYDADGDRVAFVDHTGRFIPGDYIGTILAKNSSSQSIVTTIGTSQIIDTIGKTIYRTRVGSPFVIDEMKHKDSLFGFEPNGGCIHGEVMYTRDGGTTTIKLINYLVKNKTTLAQEYAALPKFYMYKNKIGCPVELNQTILASAKKNYSGKYEELDGLKIWVTDTDWLLFRPSGNAPEFRVFAESLSPKKAQELGQAALELVKSHTRKRHTFFSDSLGILKSIHALPDQCQQVLNDISSLEIPKSCQLVNNIVVSGMGGSALGGRILLSLENQALKIPLVVSTEYHLPNFVNEKSLVIISSYSGDTEETLYSLTEARARNAQIFVITSGGKLAQISRQLKLPAYIFTPAHNPSSQPRMGLGYNILALLALLSRCQLIHPQNLSALPDFLRSRQSAINYELLAKNLVGRIPVIIASEHLKGAAHSLRNQIHENAKTFAVFFDLPEANHHLMEGLAFPSTNPQSLSFVFIESRFYHPEVSIRFALTRSVVAKQNIPTHTLSLSGDTPFFETMDLIQTGAFLSYYLAVVNAIDPGPIPWVDWFKDEIAKQ